MPRPPRFPRVEPVGDPIRLPSLGRQVEALWEVLGELSDLLPGSWTLVGGQMVLLHALEHGVAPPRVTEDIDILTEARTESSRPRDVADALIHAGFEMEVGDPTGVAHRFIRRGISVDVLAPDHLGSRADLTTVPPSRTIEVPGGRSALRRTELVPIQVGKNTHLVPRPDLAGATIAKVRAIGVGPSQRKHRTDACFLLSLIDDPFAIGATLTAAERRHLTQRLDLLDDVASWSGAVDRDRGRAALRVLAGGSARDTIR